jgi:hypothetical protein
METASRLWHEQNKMPKNPTPQQKIDWHIEHAKHCQCRPIPESVLTLMKEHKVALPKHKSAKTH